jgi:hypothetical protein
MLKYRGDTLHELGNFLGTLYGVSVGVPSTVDLFKKILGVQTLDMPKFQAEHLKNMGARLPEFKKALEEVGLETSLDSFARLESAFSQPELSYDAIKNLADEVQGRIIDELSHVQLWQLTREETRFLKVDPFGKEIPTQFPTARDDIEEAGKCLAFGRGTACVFHLMRIMEVGLRALGQSLSDPS